MRKFQILKQCYDKHTGRLLTPGTVLEVNEARAQELEKAPKYAAEIKAPEPEPVKDPEEQKEEKKAPAKKTAGRKKKA